MPWHIGAKGSHGCSGFPVIVTATGKKVGCHPTKQKAMAQLAALNINAKGADMKKREYRQVPAEYRVASGDTGVVVADVLQYDVLDDYGTAFAPGCFDESMQKRMPRMCWGHDWKDPIGVWNERSIVGKKLRLTGQLDLAMIGDTNTPAVPSAHRAHAQMKSGTIDQFSVGFVRLADEKGKVPNTFRITKGILDETSPVLVGAVPGTKLVSLRSTRDASRLTRSGVPAGTGLWIPADVVQDILLRYERSELDLADALAELKGGALTYDELPPSREDEDETEDGDENEETETETEEEEETEEEPVPEIPDDLDAALRELGLEVDA